ncbi:MAG: hypothetical protein QW463_07980 [Candidatus Caldarchaeum sp.]
MRKIASLRYLVAEDLSRLFQENGFLKTSTHKNIFYPGKTDSFSLQNSRLTKEAFGIPWATHIRNALRNLSSRLSSRAPTQTVGSSGVASATGGSSGVASATGQNYSSGQPWLGRGIEALRSRFGDAWQKGKQLTSDIGQTIGTHAAGLGSRAKDFALNTGYGIGRVLGGAGQFVRGIGQSAYNVLAAPFISIRQRLANLRDRWQAWRNSRVTNPDVSRQPTSYYGDVDNNVWDFKSPIKVDKPGVNSTGKSPTPSAQKKVIDIPEKSRGGTRLFSQLDDLEKQEHIRRLLSRKFGMSPEQAEGIIQMYKDNLDQVFRWIKRSPSYADFAAISTPPQGWASKYLWPNLVSMGFMMAAIPLSDFVMSQLFSSGSGSDGAGNADQLMKMLLLQSMLANQQGGGYSDRISPQQAAQIMALLGLQGSRIY